MKKYSKQKLEENREDKLELREENLREIHRRRLKEREKIPYHRRIPPEKYLCCGGERWNWN